MITTFLVITFLLLANTPICIEKRKVQDTFTKKVRLYDVLYDLPCILTACPLTVLTTPLPLDVLCHIPATCTSVHCCLMSHVPLNKTFSVVLDLDPCSQRILLGIEEFVHQISLYDFTFGKKNRCHYIYINFVAIFLILGMCSNLMILILEFHV